MHHIIILRQNPQLLLLFFPQPLVARSDAPNVSGWHSKHFSVHSRRSGIHHWYAKHFFWTSQIDVQRLVAGVSLPNIKSTFGLVYILGTKQRLCLVRSKTHLIMFRKFLVWNETQTSVWKQTCLLFPLLVRFKICSGFLKLYMVSTLSGAQSITDKLQLWWNIIRLNPNTYMTVTHCAHCLSWIGSGKESWLSLTSHLNIPQPSSTSLPGTEQGAGGSKGGGHVRQRSHSLLLPYVRARYYKGGGSISVKNGLFPQREESTVSIILTDLQHWHNQRQRSKDWWGIYCVYGDIMYGSQPGFCYVYVLLFAEKEN